MTLSCTVHKSAVSWTLNHCRKIGYGLRNKSKSIKKVDVFDWIFTYLYISFRKVFKIKKAENFLKT